MMQGCMRMKQKKRKSIRTGAFALALGLFCGCGGPLGPLPGGMLQGTSAAPSGNWDEVGEYEICELETNPKEPYSVTVACTIVDGQMYVNAGGSEKPWARNIRDDPNVRLRIDGRIYELRGLRVEDEAETARFGAAWTSQSWFRRDPTQFQEAWIFRLTPRPRGDEPAAPR